MSGSGSSVRARGAAANSSGQRQLSVIVPTYNETDNIRPLCERLFKATKDANLEAELVVVDDESVGSEQTAAIVKELAERDKYPIRIKSRKRSEGRGLSSAVLLGFDMAAYATILCMDADLQHEPESVPAVADPVLKGEAEFAMGSRYTAGGGFGFEWSMLRYIMSRGATVLAWPVAASTDPMSGFFCVTKEALSRGEKQINPVGFKIALEVMVRCRCSPIKDVPITFMDRKEGESKLDGKVMRHYVEQLIPLYWDKFGVLLIVFVIIVLVVGLLLANTTFQMITR